MVFHPLHTDIPRPDKFTYPFCYTPHPLCLQAAGEVQRYLVSGEEWREEIRQGKMFGVLVVEDAGGAMGFLAAYSGILAGRNDWPYFVPAVYDALQPDGYFRLHEAEITDINRQVEAMSRDAGQQRLKDELDELRLTSHATVESYQRRMKQSKAGRDARRRQGGVSDEEHRAMIRESQFMKAELHRLKQSFAARIASAASLVESGDQALQRLKTLRKRKSDALQHWLFNQFDMLNANGERRNLCSIFAGTVKGVPPAGAGECCAPKLLQYAYLHQLHPLCMAEFWWGASPRTEVRHHLHYYPACRGKCLPILTHMLQGLTVEANPLDTAVADTFEVVYDDAWLVVVNKPAGMLSVPGKGGRPSVLSLVREMYPGAEGPMIVHRLDMATSGLLVVAKTKTVHRHLQEQFKNHQVRKRYVALLDGILHRDRGVITLPLSPDPLDRPRQVVDMQQGRAAVTTFQVLSVAGGRTRVALFPHTGRTHQLRVHCAHHDGLSLPIVGDTLYGSRSDRLYLHAAEITFVHPVTNKKLRFIAEPEF